ncbi:MAG: cytochrome C oxidase subunit IV family protein [Gemmatimonadetes bacterium]|nr:cytochrome C oxidase subunit IV family protein [Gemmatimonadota bacterium]
MSEDTVTKPLHAHPSVRTYLAIAAILTGITVVEVAMFYIPAISATAALAPVLLVLSAAKFALVVMFFMHLKPDSKIFTIIFTAPLLLAGLMILALMTLLGAWWLG